VYVYIKGDFIYYIKVCYLLRTIFFYPCVLARIKTHVFLLFTSTKNDQSFYNKQYVLNKMMYKVYGCNGYELLIYDKFDFLKSLIRVFFGHHKLRPSSATHKSEYIYINISPFFKYVADALEKLLLFSYHF